LNFYDVENLHKLKSKWSLWSDPRSSSSLNERHLHQ